MKTPKPDAKIQIGISLTMALTVWGAFSYYQSGQIIAGTPDPFMIARQLVRLEPVRHMVPEDAVMGYFSDTPPGTLADILAFDGVRYALTPRLLRPGAWGEWVLGNFRGPIDLQTYAAQRRLRVEHDFGNGVVLFRKGER